MVVEVLKGRQVKSKYPINQSIIDDFSAKLKQTPESELHRMIIKMLILGVLEEQFVSTRIKGGSSNISVYLGLGKRH